MIRAASEQGKSGQNLESHKVELLFDQLWGSKPFDPRTILERCRGCDFISAPGKRNLGGEDVGIHLVGERCPQCGGRMQRLFLQAISKRRRGIPREDYIRHEEEGYESEL